MLQELILMLGNTQPSNLNVFLEVAAVIGVIGLLLWLMGARYSRQIVALCGVASGAMAGKLLPQIVPSINLSAPVLAIGGALIFGVLAFITHRLWIGFFLGSMLTVWASLGTWITMHGQQSWSQPVWDADMTLRRFGTDLWSVLPPDVARILPWAAGGAMVSGIAMAILWPRIAAALNWSLAGATMLVLIGLAATCFARPQWLGKLPAQTSTQIAVFAGMVLFGAIVQWKVSPPGVVRKLAKPAPASA